MRAFRAILVAAVSGCLLALVCGLVLAASPPPGGSLMASAKGGGSCFSEGGQGGLCRAAPGLGGLSGVAVSPDGRSVYTSAADDSAIAVFVRRKSSGVLSKPASSSCFADPDGGESCVSASGVAGVTAVAVSPDGRDVYSVGTDALAVFARSAPSGGLKEVGCIGESFQQAPPDGCTIGGKLLTTLNTVAVSPDGRTVYAGSDLGIAIFDRHGDGTLSQPSGAAGCLADTGTDEVDAGVCTGDDQLGRVRSIVVSADGRFLYASGDNVVTVFARTANRALMPLPGSSGCVEDKEALASELSPVCAPATDLQDAAGLALSGDGRFLYVATGSDTIDVFSRSVTTGALTQLAGSAGCVGSAAPCSTARLLAGPTAVAVSRDGRDVYVASTADNAVLVFSRGEKTGVLRQLVGRYGCVGGPGYPKCVAASAVNGVDAIIVSPDGKSLYASTNSLGAVSAFKRCLPPAKNSKPSCG